MIIKAFLEQLIIVYLSISPMDSTITFPFRVLDYKGAKQSLINVTEFSDDPYSIYIQTKKDFKNIPFTVITEGGRYHLSLTTNKARYRPVVTIHPAKKELSGEVVVNNKSYEIVETKSNIVFTNKTDRPITVNGNSTSLTRHLSKGSPVFVNKKEVFFRQ